MASHSAAARHSIAEARALLQSAKANVHARRCLHGGTEGRCRLCAPVEPPVRDGGDRVDRYLVSAD